MDDEKLARFERAVANLSAALSIGYAGNQSNISVNAGGLGVVIASVCCAVMFTITLVGGFVGLAAYRDLKDEFAEVRDDQRATKAYLQGIWQQAPHLKPPQEKSK